MTNNRTDRAREARKLERESLRIAREIEPLHRDARLLEAEADDLDWLGQPDRAAAKRDQAGQLMARWAEGNRQVQQLAHDAGAITDNGDVLLTAYADSITPAF